MWLYEATLEKDYLYYAVENAHSLGGSSWTMTEFSWDVKYAGVQVLASKVMWWYTIIYTLIRYIFFGDINTFVS